MPQGAPSPRLGPPAPSMARVSRAAVVPGEGWGVLHLFFRLAGEPDREAVSAAVKRAESDGYQVVSGALLGHKADAVVMVLGPDLWRLRDVQSELCAAGLELVWSYVSLTEVSEYSRALPAERREDRLHPRLPPRGLPAFGFYPMSKRRDGSDNWYMLPFDERRRLMGGHGGTGRRFSGRVLQLITGSTGLDDWEWGVTLFAAAPDDLKEVVSAMRYDEASARFAEFGPFFMGMVTPIDELLESATTARQ